MLSIFLAGTVTPILYLRGPVQLLYSAVLVFMANMCKFETTPLIHVHQYPLMLRRFIISVFFYFFGQSFFYAQIDSNTVIRFDFNDHQIKEVNNRITIKPVGVSLVNDRFGNEKSAVYIFGHATSYINLGASPLLKPSNITLSMWINIQDGSLAGKGYDGNPIIIMKNGPGEDFILGYGIFYNYIYKRLGCISSRDSLKEVAVSSKDTTALATWYHIVMASDSNYFAFYINGELQAKALKGFTTKLTAEDSVVIGRSTGNKNERYTNGLFDDIRIFHRVLTEKEILDLYNEPNPNRFKIILREIITYGSGVLILGGVIVMLILRNRRNLKKQKEYYELNNKITELELKVIRTQMNPHFISNNLAAIQNLIYQKEVDTAADYLAKFSFFLRQVLDYSDRTYTSLKEELEIIALNAELEGLRFKNSFAFTMQADDNVNLMETYLPSLISQPFIENAIWHGLLPLEGRLPALLVRVYTANKFTYLEIEDNGVGRSASENNTEKTSKGTKLVMDKIDSINRLRNSTDYTLKIVDLFDAQGKPCGTKVIIELTPHTYEE